LAILETLAIFGERTIWAILAILAILAKGRFGRKGDFGERTIL